MAEAADDISVSVLVTTSWTDLLSEDFEEGLGAFFVPGSNEHVTYYPQVLGRDGVVRVYGDGADNLSAIYSGAISLDSTSTLANIATEENALIKVVFSYYANSMEGRDGFCLDLSVDKGRSWSSMRCWHATDDFVDGIWYDDAEATFELGGDNDNGVANWLRIRFRNRGDSDKDDLLIDKVNVLLGVAVKDVIVATELKDSI